MSRRVPRARVVVVVTGIAVLASAAPLLAAPQRKATTVDVEDLIARLSAPDEAADAARELSALGERAVGPLSELAASDAALLPRGWALAVLAGSDDARARQLVSSLSDDERQSPLMRAWANAARLRSARSLDEVLQLSSLLDGAPALERPFAARALALLPEARARNDDESVRMAERLLAAGRDRAALQRALYPVLASLGPRPLVVVTIGHESPALRRLAAAHLASLARRGAAHDVKAALLEGLRFDKAASAPPWSGGPLVLPDLPLDDDSGIALLGTLLRWYVWTEQQGDVTHGRPLHDVLAAVAGAALPGATIPGWYARSSVEWLQVWKQAAGAREVSRLLDEQDLHDDERYRALLKESP